MTASIGTVNAHTLQLGSQVSLGLLHWARSVCNDDRLDSEQYEYVFDDLPEIDADACVNQPFDSE